MSASITATTSRRRPARPSGSSSVTPSLIDSFNSMSLRKGDTFHAPSAAVGSDFWDPLDSKARAPTCRSPTCPKSLEDLLVGAGERRVAELMAKVDDAAQIKSKLAITNVLTEPEVLPIPTFAVHDTTVDHSVEERKKKRTHRHSHASDSGIGSSIASEEAAGSPAQTSKTVSRTTASNRSSMSDISSATEQRGLSKYACEQIHKYIVKPILREDALKDFHPLIKDVPERIGKKEIKTLRDLEKTLIFLAPDYSRSPSKYLQFCERTVRVLHTTVTTLHESDQRAPADRPYTQGYFFDLVEQIRRYASILAATREKKAKGEELDEMDYSPDERVTLIGGMSHNGRPAELVRQKNGKAISIATGQALNDEELASASNKRPMAEEFDADLDDEASRSMARRKKNAKPEIHPCSICDKEFKRPCDLTKHVKTHERPWKCPDEMCKYHEHGWPTEKERDRHVNDKHSNAPSLYHCLFSPCPYTSKRESNCKQHMEKAHGWEYVRSKNNGKGRASMPRLPQGSVPQSPASSMLTPITNIAASPSDVAWSNSSRRESIAPIGAPGPSSWANTPNFAETGDFAGHFNFDFNNMWPITPAMSDERRLSSDALSSNSGIQLDGSAFDETFTPDEIYDNAAFTFGENDFSFDHITAQPPISPNSGLGSSISASSSAILPPQNTSPGAQLDQTFSTAYYEHMNVDHQQDFSAVGGTGDASAPGQDFTLYGTAAGAQGAVGGDMFAPLPEDSVDGNGNSAHSWGGFASQLDSGMRQTPGFSTGDSALEELFPGMNSGNHGL